MPPPLTPEQIKRLLAQYGMPEDTLLRQDDLVGQALEPEPQGFSWDKMGENLARTDGPARFKEAAYGTLSDTVKGIASLPGMAYDYMTGPSGKDIELPADGQAPQEEAPWYAQPRSGSEAVGNVLPYIAPFSLERYKTGINNSDPMQIMGALAGDVGLEAGVGAIGAGAIRGAKAVKPRIPKIASVIKDETGNFGKSTAELAALNRAIGEANKAGNKELAAQLIEQRKAFSGPKAPPKEPLPTSPPDQMGFTSPLVKAFELQEQKAFTPEQAMNVLRGSANKERIANSGLDTFMAGRPSATKEEIIAHLQSTEPTLVQNNQRAYKTIEEVLTPQELKRWRRLDNLYSQDRTPSEAADFAALNKKAQDANIGSGNTRFGDYTVKGGTNYSENLTKWGNRPGRANYNPSPDEIKAELPQMMIDHGYSQADADRAIQGNHAHQSAIEMDAIERLRQRRDAAHPPQRPFTQSHWHNDPDVSWHTRTKDRNVGGKNTHYVEEIQSDWHQKGRDHGYVSDVPDLRTKVTDAEQVMNTIQRQYNDLDQQLRDARREQRMNPTPEQDAKVAQLDAEYRTVAQTYHDANLAADRARQSLMVAKDIPEGPFKTTWEENAIKQELTKAAKGPYEQFGWATGHQNADHYHMSHQFNDLRWEPDTNSRGGGGYLKGTKKNGNDFDMWMDNELKLRESVGEGLADRLLKKDPDTQGFAVYSKQRDSEAQHWNDPRTPIWDRSGNDPAFFSSQQEAQAYMDEKIADWADNANDLFIDDYQIPSRYPKLSGEGLEFGGEGMKSFYDERMKNTVRKLTGQEPELRPLAEASADELTARRQALMQERENLYAALIKAEQDSLQGRSQPYFSADQERQWNQNYSRAEQAYEDATSEFNRLQPEIDKAKELATAGPSWFINLPPELKQRIREKGFDLATILAILGGGSMAANQQSKQPPTDLLRKYGAIN